MGHWIFEIGYCSKIAVIDEFGATDYDSCHERGKRQIMDEFWDWWQHLPQNISPVIFEIGSFKLQYYGLMYIVAFAVTFLLVLYRVKHEDRFDMTTNR